MKDSTGSDLLYFTHLIDGDRYGGWYRSLSDDCIEVLAIGFIRTILPNGRSPEVVACEALEEFIRVRKLQGAPLPVEPVSVPAPHHECSDSLQASRTRSKLAS